MSGFPSNIETVYVELLNEGTFVLRPVPAVRIGELSFRLLATDDYDAELETWSFPPGATVKCALESHGGDNILVAKHKL